MTAPVELLLNYLPVDEEGKPLRDDTTLVNPETPLLHPDGMDGGGPVVAVPRVGEKINLRVRHHESAPNSEQNEVWEVVDVLWTMSDISRQKKTPTQIATLRMKKSDTQF